MGDDEFSDDDFFDDGLGFPPLGHQSPWIIIRRKNPFGKLQLPPIKRLRPGYQLPINSASSGSVDQPSLAAGYQLPINSASSGSVDQASLAAERSPRRKTV